MTASTVPGSAVERWLRRQAGREGRGVLLEEALLGDRMWEYTRHRLRYFFLKYLVETAVHTVTVLVLLFDLSWREFLPVVVTIAATSLLSAFWWGALEALRTQVRDLHRTGKPHVIPRVIGGWLAFAGVLGGAVLALAAGLLLIHAVRGALGAPEVFVSVLLLRLAVDLPTRCYHSGVYALRRIYKPLPAVVGSLVLELGVIVVLYPLVGLWSLVVSSLVLTAVLSGVTWRYTSRVYHFVGHDPLAEVRLRAIRRSLRGAAGEMLQAGLSNAVIAVDSLVVLALLYGAAIDAEALLVLFLAAPSIKAGADWARLFYFDLKRLELTLFSNVRRRFERHTRLLAWTLGAVFWALACVLATAVLQEWLGLLYLSLLVFFMARSGLARVQLEAFAEGSYRPVLVTGGLLAVGLAGVTVTVDDQHALLAGVAGVTAASAVALGVLRARARRRGEEGVPLLTLDWLQRLGEVQGPVRVCAAVVLPGSGPERLDVRTREARMVWRLSQLAEQAARVLGGRGEVAFVGPETLVWYEVADVPQVITARWLQVASGGLTGRVRAHSCDGGEEALFVAGHEGLLGRASHHLLTAVVPVDVAEARRRFAAVFPSGAVYSPDEPVPPPLQQLGGAELKAILIDAVAFARDLQIRRRRARHDVTALCAGGELRLIFVTGLTEPRRARARWQQQVTGMNVQAAVGGTRQAWQPAVVGRRWPTGVSAGVAGRWLAGRRPAGDQARLEALARVPLLSALADDEVARVATAMSPHAFTAGEELTRQGEPGVGFYVIDEGQASVRVHGREVARLGPGDHFGELALIAETPRTATVVALTDLRCLRMTSWEFRRLVEGSAPISWHVLQATARMLWEAQAVDEHVAPADAEVVVPRGTRDGDLVG